MLAATGSSPALLSPHPVGRELMSGSLNVTSATVDSALLDLPWNRPPDVVQQVRIHRKMVDAGAGGGRRGRPAH